jgi:large subunit ribosomal protein L3
MSQESSKSAGNELKLMGKKRGMAQIFDENGVLVPCTVIHVEPNVITQIKTRATDGYEAVQLAFHEIKVKDERTMSKRCSKPLLGHFKKASVTPRKELIEARVHDASSYKVGDAFGVSLFQGIQFVDVVGTSKGKGYQGVMKLHGFRGGPGSHGSGFHRHAGSTGMRSSPGRCLPGGPRPSHMGDERVTVQNLRIVAIDETNNLLMVEGATPGSKGTSVVVYAAYKRKNKKEKTK